MSSVDTARTGNVTSAASGPSVNGSTRATPSPESGESRGPSETGSTSASNLVRQTSAESQDDDADPTLPAETDIEQSVRDDTVVSDKLPAEGADVSDRGSDTRAEETASEVDHSLSSLMSELSGHIRKIKLNKLYSDDQSSAADQGGNTRTATSLRSTAKSGATSTLASETPGLSSGESDDDESDDETDSIVTDAQTRASDVNKSGSKSSSDKNRCKICSDRIDDGRKKLCVKDHVICFDCFDFRDKYTTEEEALPSNACIVCQREVLDPEEKIDGYPPRFSKFYIIRKLLEKDPGFCDVATSHARGQAQAEFFCIDCDVNACRSCLLNHLDGGEKSSHNLLSLLVATYQSEKLYCFSCHVNEAVAYCTREECDLPLCKNCVREKHKFHQAFNLNESQRNMIMYINKQQAVIFQYRKGVDVELQMRKDLREAKQEELEILTDTIKEAAEKHRKMIDEDEQKLLEVVEKHKTETFAAYTTLDEAIARKDIILKYFENIHSRLREKKMDELRAIDAFNFCRENDGLLKTHKEMLTSMSRTKEHELVEMRFAARDLMEKYRLQGNNILGVLNVKEKKLDPDRFQISQYTLSIEVRGRIDRTKPEISSLLYLRGTSKLAIVDAANCRVKIVSKYDGNLYSSDPDVRIDYIDNGEIIKDGDRVLLAWNERDQLLLVCNASTDMMYVYALDGKRVWHYSLPPGAGKALSLHHTSDGTVYVGRSHISMDKQGGILEIHVMLRKGRYQLLRQKDRYYIDHRPKWITTTPSGYTIIYDGSTLVYLTKSLNQIRTEDRRHKDWHGLEASDLYMTDRGHLVIVDPLNLYADNSITVLNEDGYVLGFPLASSGEEDDPVQGPTLITGDHGPHFYLVDSHADRIKVLQNV